MFYCGKEPSCNGLGLVGKHKALLILFNKPLRHVSPEQLPQTFRKALLSLHLSLSLIRLCYSELSRRVWKLLLYPFSSQFYCRFL